MKTLWVNADDFGLTPAVSAGIAEAMTRGAVATTTAMVCTAHAGESLRRLAPPLRGRVGLHLQLTGGVPRSDPAAVASLVGADGRLPRWRRQVGRLEPGEVEREWRAQLSAFRELGLEPCRLDSHHHVHSLPGAFEVFCRLARELAVPARANDPHQVRELRRGGVECADVFCQDFFGGPLDLEHFLRCVARAAAACPEGGSIEVMTHPGRVDDALRAGSSYVEERERELRTLCSPELASALHELGVRLADPPAP